ncbi:MAG: hypothetical protein V3V14_08120 [Saprospiraceae bacterium]
MIVEITGKLERQIKKIINNSNEFITIAAFVRLASEKMVKEILLKDLGKVAKSTRK